MYEDNGPIAAIATAPGRGAIGVLRLSGKDLRGIAAAFIGRAPEPRVAMRARFLDRSGNALDDGLALFFPAPNSYTGEDVLELQGHGGPMVLQMLLRRSLELGARPAEPGEFTRRAFLNEKLDLAQAESVADLIEAATESAARSALRSLRGEFSAAIETLLSALIDLRVFAEATLDFPEEEIDTGDRDELQRKHAELKGAIEKVLEKSRQGSVLRSGLRVVLAGKPNVGKSSLLNALAGDDIAIVTATPGTTRDSVRELIHIDGVPLHVIDTAGLRETADEVERLGIARAWSEISKADVVLLVTESGDDGGELAWTEQIPDRAKRIYVRNKIDLSGMAPAAAPHERGTRLLVSAKTGAGIDLLRSELLDIAGWHAGTEDVFMARERHLLALERARTHIEHAGERYAQAELFAEELRLAQEQLGSICGEFVADDLLGEIFSRFCIGK